MSVDTVTIKNAGPIPELDIRFQPEGGVTLVKGRNGAGKTHALDSVQSLISGKGKVPVRDHQTKAEVEGFGATLRISKTARRTGEVDVVSLEGRFDLSVLWDPGIASPEAADAKRIKSLVQLSGTKADHTLFHKLAASEEEFNRIVKPESIATDDLVTMAARVKRDFDAAARQAEDEAANLNAQVTAARESAKDIDLEAPCDSSELSAAYDRAVRQKAAMETEADHRRKVLAEAAECSRSIEAHTAKASSVDEAKEKSLNLLKEVDAKSRAVTDAEAKVTQLKAELARAEDAVEYAKESLKATREQYDSSLELCRAAESLENTLKEWRETVAKAANVQPITLAEMQAAEDAVTAASAAVELGVKVREAKKSLQRADQTEVQAKEASRRAERLRDAAKSTDDVLSEAVKSDVLRVSAGRLVLDTERGKDIPLAELSDGERWKIALDEAVKHIGEGGLIVLPQHAWDAQDPDNQVLIHEEAKRRKVHVLTGKRDRGDLRVEPFDPQTAA